LENIWKKSSCSTSAPIAVDALEGGDLGRLNAERGGQRWIVPPAQAEGGSVAARGENAQLFGFDTRHEGDDVAQQGGHIQRCARAQGKRHGRVLRTDFAVERERFVRQPRVRQLVVDGVVGTQDGDEAGVVGDGRFEDGLFEKERGQRKRDGRFFGFSVGGFGRRQVQDDVVGFDREVARFPCGTADQFDAVGRAAGVQRRIRLTHGRGVLHRLDLNKAESPLRFRRREVEQTIAREGLLRGEPLDGTGQTEPGAAEVGVPAFRRIAGGGRGEERVVGQGVPERRRRRTKRVRERLEGTALHRFAAYGEGERLSVQRQGERGRPCPGSVCRG
jgi:hypothetical protein